MVHVYVYTLRKAEFITCILLFDSTLNKYKCSVYIYFLFQSLFSTTALGLGGKYFLYYELEGVGCQWDNIMISPREHDQFTLFLVLLMMIVDSFIYFILAWYIENIHPGMDYNYSIDIHTCYLHAYISCSWYQETM